MAWMTAGLSWSAGCDPAEVTRTRPAACWSSSAAAIWDRPALWVQTNSTCGMSAMGNTFLGSACELGGLPGADRAGPGRVEGEGQERAVIGQPGSGDARPDHDRNQQAGAGELGLRHR
jgi:hypothetical protein